ncbi:hypothetical protein ATI61_102408 [Archangium gephyra]|uniref:Uncharacterized protein n=1 Tax=Archangium gephyra TaxID=48 RepID=A0AAC8QCS1_9BACT|nr:hypothetical protein [Archangium gephyra]AKJ05347.1 Hypothetical protein AA314_06973 [Archangium gephyra]REG36034.1 hypothetical protein ATI61_102408 [Archangium gephyra]
MESIRPRHRNGRRWAKLRSLESTLSFLEEQQEGQRNPQASSVIRNLRERLKQAEAWLESRRWKPRIPLDNCQFWELIHGVGADLLLILPLDMLATEALMVEENFRRNIHEPIARATWLGGDEKSGPLCTAVRCITELSYRVEGLRPEEELKLRHARQILRSALRQVHRHSDRYFLQLDLTMMIRSLSGTVLVLMFVLTLVTELPAQFAGLILRSSVELPWKGSTMSTLSLVLLGVGGAITANMLSERPVLVMRGPFWRQFVYYLFVKPSIGAVAAFLFYLLAISQLFFSIETVPSPLSALDPLQGAGQLQPALRIVLGNNEALVCTYALLLLAVGFSAERFLSPIMDRVMSKLFVMADKTEPSPGTPVPAPPPPRTPAPAAPPPAPVFPGEPVRGT